jgi:hypothetical protein
MTRLLAAALSLVISTAFAAGPPLEDMRWARPDADHFLLLSAAPGECVGPVAREDRYKVDVGAVAFRSPFLFGGVAARTGLSCNACHRDGHGNPDFYLEGLSGAPGTADVTSSVFSEKREDGVFNPVPIPTLVGISGKATFGTSPPHGSIEDFVASAVTDEFAGETAPFLVAAIADYVSRFRSGACPPHGIGVNVSTELKYPRIALETAQEALRRGDMATADFLLLAARGLLKRVAERFDDASLGNERAALRSLSVEIENARNAIDADAETARGDVQSLALRLNRVEILLRESEPRSLYDRGTLRRHLETAREQAK